MSEPSCAFPPIFPAAPVRAISLDLDDTLWSARQVLVHAEETLARWLAAHAPRTAERLTPELRKAIRHQLLADHPERAHDLGFVRREFLRRAIAGAGEDPSLAEPAFEVFLAARQAVTLYEDVRPVLTAWAARMPVIAVSNGNADVVRVGLGDCFRGALAAHAFGVAKPDPRIFHEACRLAGVPPAQVLHVGDDPLLDVRAARQAGLQAAWLRRPDLFAGDDAQADREARAQAGDVPVFESLAALDGWLAQSA